MGRQRMGYEAVARVILPATTPEDMAGLLASLRLEAMSDPVWLSRTQRLDRCSLRGVPAARIDVLVDPDVHHADLACVEVGRKAGRYDGAVRSRLTIRRWQADTLPHPPAGRLVVDDDEGSIDLTLFSGDAIVWSGSYDRLRSDLEHYDLSRIVLWHASRYYRFLLDEPGADIDGFARAWPVEWAYELTGVRVADMESAGRAVKLAGATLAEANRAASRALYALARSYGWRKLTLREQTRWGLTGQWHRDEVVAAARQRVLGLDGDITGTGEDTRCAARTGRWHSDEARFAIAGPDVPFPVPAGMESPPE